MLAECPALQVETQHAVIPKFKMYINGQYAAAAYSNPGVLYQEKTGIVVATIYVRTVYIKIFWFHAYLLLQ